MPKQNFVRYNKRNAENLLATIKRLASAYQSPSDDSTIIGYYKQLLNVIAITALAFDLTPTQSKNELDSLLKASRNLQNKLKKISPELPILLIDTGNAIGKLESALFDTIPLMQRLSAHYEKLPKRIFSKNEAMKKNERDDLNEAVTNIFEKISNQSLEVVFSEVGKKRDRIITDLYDLGIIAYNMLDTGINDDGIKASIRNHLNNKYI